MLRPQFTIRALLALILAVACFFAGVRAGRQQQRREDEAATQAAKAALQAAEATRLEAEIRAVEAEARLATQSNGDGPP